MHMTTGADTTRRLPDRVRALAEEALQGRPLYVVEVEVRGARGSQVVDVYVDSDEGVSVDELAELSRELGFLMDTEEVIDTKYNLNVSSPGLDRPLRLPRQYRRYVGREVVVEYRPEGAPEAAPEQEQETRVAAGTVRAADEDGFRLELDPDEHAEGGTLALAYDRILEARPRLPW